MSDGREDAIFMNGILRRANGGGVLQPIIPVSGNFNVFPLDSGAIYVVKAANIAGNLPDTQPGLVYTFVVRSLSASGTGFAVSPKSADKIMGNGFTSADNKDAINSFATDREGDMIQLVGDGVDGWYVVGVIGTWAREA